MCDPSLSQNNVLIPFSVRPSKAEDIDEVEREDVVAGVVDRDRLMSHNVVPFTGRGRADDHSNHGKRSAAAVQCSGGLSTISAVPALRAFVRNRPRADDPGRLKFVE